MILKRKKWSAGFVRFLQVSALASHWLEDCANFTQTPEENDQYSANQYKHHAKLLSVNSFIPLVISRNDKNKQQIVLRQRKLVLTTINKLIAL
jgi:hypothetical protein